ncbi:MAG: SAM-dependent methyltransferase [Firmicutes bacterium]|nr:SAM-dependent methyltransferase [Bacillota bacterium]
MLSGRLLTIAKLVKPNASVLDVGTDHAYLPIYLKESKVCKKVIASDISPNALEGARKNIEKFQVPDIKLILSDGLEKIEDDYDTLIISGMGTKTIIHILYGQKLPENIILSSNNNLYELRKYMNKIGYKIKEEVTCYDKGKWYDIIYYEKGIERLSEIKLLYGKSKDKTYYHHLYEKEKLIYKELKLKNKIKNIPRLFILKVKSI